MFIDMGAAVQGYEAGLDRQNKQEMLKMQKEQFMQTSAMNQQTMDKNEQLLEQGRRLEEAQKRLKADADRKVLDDGLVEAFKSKTPQELNRSLEVVNQLDIMKGQKLAGLTSEDLQPAVKYLVAKGMGTKPYILEDGKYRAPNELDPEEVQQARINASNDDKVLAQKYIDNAQLVKNPQTSQVAGLEDIASITGHFTRRPSSQIQNDEIIAGLRDKKKETGKSGAESPFGKFFSDMQNLGIKDATTIQRMYSEIEKNPDYGQAISNLNARGLPTTQDNLNREMQAIKGTIPKPDKPDKPAPEKTTATTAYRDMIILSDKLGVDFSKPDAMEKFNKLDVVSQDAMKSAAKELFKNSGEQLARTDILAKHLHTLASLNVSPESLDESIKSAAGLGDVTINGIKQYFTTDSGIEFKKQFKQTFNSLLTTGSQGRVTNAELENLQDAFGSLSASNEAVFQNFKSMVVAMKSQIDAYSVTAPVAAKILYGKQINAYEQVLEMLDKADSGTLVTKKGSDNTITTNDGKKVPGLNFKGAE